MKQEWLNNNKNNNSSGSSGSDSRVGYYVLYFYCLEIKRKVKDTQ